LLDGIEHFFVAYNDAQGRQFKPLARHGPRKAQKLIDEAIHRAHKAQARKRKKAAKRQAGRRRSCQRRLRPGGLFVQLGRVGP